MKKKKTKIYKIVMWVFIILEVLNTYLCYNLYSNEKQNYLGINTLRFFKSVFGTGVNVEDPTNKYLICFSLSMVLLFFALVSYGTIKKWKG